jgi:hypothetical protein
VQCGSLHTREPERVTRLDACSSSADSSRPRRVLEVSDLEVEVSMSVVVCKVRSAPARVVGAVAAGLSIAASGTGVALEGEARRRVCAVEHVS